MEIEEFIKDKKRMFKAKQTQTNRVLRLKTLCDLANKHTELYILGKIEEGNFLTLQDTKNYLSKLPNNPFDMVEGEANAKICADWHKLCIKGVVIDGKKQQFVCKELSINRVGYFNVQYARELIANQKDKNLKTKMETRLKLINDLPIRAGYQPL